MYEIKIPNRLLNSPHSSNPLAKANDSRNSNKPVTKTVSDVVTERVIPIDTDEFTDKDTEELCEIFINKYPNKSEQDWVRSNWKQLDLKLQLQANFEMIMMNIATRKEYDKNWLAGHIHSAQGYLQETRWFEKVS